MARRSAIARGSETLRWLSDFIWTRRATSILLVVSLSLGLAYALTMLPLSLVTGTGAFWEFPHGNIGGSQFDMAQNYSGYLNILHAPWQIPLLFSPNLNAPQGGNAFWVDPVPWIALIGRLASAAVGKPVNLLGVYMLACLALPGAAMTLLLASAGQRSLVAALAGTVMAEATPSLLYRWGHYSLMGQFWIIGGMTLYLLNRRDPDRVLFAILWIAVLDILLLTNVYLLAIVAPLWLAAQAQNVIDRRSAMRRVLAGAIVTLGSLVGLMLLVGIFSPDLRSVGTPDFGVYSMNLASPFIPQMSGLIPGLANYRMGMNSQYEGFAYLGLGALILAAATMRLWLGWLRIGLRRNAALFAVLAGFAAFSLSNKIYLGSRLILEIPLPDSILYVFGMFRSSGRFFWPVGYAILAGSLVLALRHFRRPASLTLLIAVSVLQVLDTEPLRAAIAVSASGPAPPIVDRRQIDALAARATAIMVFPSFGCIDDLAESVKMTHEKVLDLRRMNLEFQLVAARRNLPINTIYSARMATDCRAEDTVRRAALRPGVLYVYVAPPRPDAGNAGAGSACQALGDLMYCFLPPG